MRETVGLSLNSGCKLVLVLLFGCLSGSIAAAEQSEFSQSYRSPLPHNAESCVGCHAIPDAGGSSKVTVSHGQPSSKATETTKSGANASTLLAEINTASKDMLTGARVVPTIRGDAYIEAIPESDILAVAAAQVRVTHGVIHGQPTRVTVLAAAGKMRALGRFGWKAQHASLLSASADALRNEIGIPNRLFDQEQVTSPRSAGRFDLTQIDRQKVDTDGLLQALDRFVHSTEPIIQDREQSETESARIGSELFDSIGCSICHVRAYRTAPAGTHMIGNTVVVSNHLGSKEIHPFSDFLLHDIGTGDHIAQNVRPQDYDEHTLDKFRTAPLWGLRYRSWLMHDGASVTYHQAIMRHQGEAMEVIERYKLLTPVEKEELREFLNSL